MPASAPGSLTSDETYALVAWLLAKNEIITEGDTMNRETLPRVRMPARARFVPDSRRGGAEVK
jgi:cytochrome c